MQFMLCSLGRNEGSLVTLCSGVCVSGDLFIIVYSIDCRESFEETIRLRNQIYEAKLGQSTPPSPTQARSRRRRQLVPIVIVGNKSDLETRRKVEAEELRGMVETHPVLCDVVECSAKKNINIEEIFVKLFLLAKVPTEMSPSLHRRVQPTYIGSSTDGGGGGGGGGASRRLMSLRRRLSDACGAVALNARRPSIRTDLLTLQMRQNLFVDSGGDAEFARMDLARCSIQ